VQKELTGLQYACPKLRRLSIEVLYERSPKNQSNELKKETNSGYNFDDKCFVHSSPILLNEDYDVLDVIAKSLSTGGRNIARKDENAVAEVDHDWIGILNRGFELEYLQTHLIAGWST